jgi:prepilin-type processing-associated H-X9-DG protein
MKTRIRLLDMMVIVLVVGGSLGLFMAWVTEAREGGRRLQCQNNMRNVGLGLVQYLTAKGVFPNAGTFHDDPAVHQSDPLKSSIYQALTNPSAFTTTDNPCLPNWAAGTSNYFDYAGLYNSWNFHESYLSGTSPGPGAPSNFTMGNTTIPMLHCPDDPTTSPNQGNLSYVVNGGFSLWHAIPLSRDSSATNGIPRLGGPLCWSPAGTPWQENQAIARKLGVMFLGTHTGDQPWDIKTRPADIADGASHTLLLSENIWAGYSTGTKHSGGLPTNWTCPLPTFSMFIGSDDVCHSSASATDCLGGQLAPLSATKSGPGWARANRLGSGEEINDAGKNTVEGGSPYPSSLHPGGVNVVFCDGSCRFLVQSIDGSVYASLLTPAGTRLPQSLRQAPYSSTDMDP